MHLRAVHAEENIAVLQQLVRENPLGILTTAIQSPLHPLIQSSHIPFVIDVPETEDGGSPSNGTLRGHIARQNPQAKVLMEALAARKEQGHDGLELPDEVLVLFNGAHHPYVTPKFYTETKPVSGKVVPTWNYSAVQAYGKIKVFCDSKAEETNAFLQRQVEDLTRLTESSIMGYTGEGGRPAAWEVADAPTPYVEILRKGIIGIEIKVDRLQGKFKMSQEMSKGDREGVVRGFDALGTEAGKGMAQTIAMNLDKEDNIPNKN
ncbi:negative transcriptional regulator [Coccidioides immitis H538.4]|uniref:Negative transcriptional regulator n=1 Tax=Coccidioides immitis H538.4 TaxID=396776 RepID=A0A0J8RTS5_COCIT|nr:negative transcriptional regulator [Coccidioides immitis H538.4]